MSDRFAPLHCPSTGFLRRSQARTGLSKLILQSLDSITFITQLKESLSNYD